MEDRAFTEIELRGMLEHASGFRADAIAGRFVVACSLRRRPWSVIVEPDTNDRLLVVITAYPLEH